MDSLLVDLDKVLDDFEAEENSAPGSELKPSGYKEFLEQENNQNLENTDIYRHYEHEFYPSAVTEKEIKTVQYDFPYEPEQFDLSDADFAPSTNISDSKVNGADHISYNNSDEPLMHNLKQVNGDSMETYQMNGDVAIDTHSSHASQGLYGVTNGKEKNLNLKLHVPPWDEVKTPVQADISPGGKPSEMAFQTNGHLDFQNTQLSSIPSLSTINSSPEYDKYPVQCNTPQTPKDLVVNPLEAQLAQCSTSNGLDKSSHVNSSAIDSKSDVEAMQDIPKLQTLKNDLEMSCDETKVEHQRPCLNTTQSLPASFHERVTQSAVDSSSSLPSELKPDVFSASDKSIVKTKDQVDGDVKTEQDLDSAKSFSDFNKRVCEDTDMADTNTYNLNEAFPKDATGMEQTVKSENKQVPVGFGNIDDVDDDTELNEYLGEECGDLIITGRNTNKPGSGLLEKESGYCQMNSTEIQNSRSIDNVLKSEESSEQNGDERTNVDEIYMDTSDNGSRTDINSVVVKGGDLKVISPQMNANSAELDHSDLEVLKVLPLNPSDLVSKSNNVASDLSANLSPVANMSLDSGVASLNDNLDDNSTVVDDLSIDKGARPKDSLNLVRVPKSYGCPDSASPFVMMPVVSGEGSQMCGVTENMMVDEESRQFMESSKGDFYETHTDMHSGYSESGQSDVTNSDVEQSMHSEDGVVTSRPKSFGGFETNHPSVQKQKRPTSLNLPPPPTINPSDDSEMSDDGSPGADTAAATATSAAHDPDHSEIQTGPDDVASAEGGTEAPPTASEHMHVEPPPPYPCTLGKVAPKWIPDSEAPICMSCEVRFTFTKRRHHCRACGKVFCSTCCSMKNKLPYLNQEARVCVICHSELALAEAGWSTHPNNPNDYCSLSPQSQAAGATAQPTAVLVPVLKRDGSSRHSAPKQVMFSDGIRPGCDLTELDGSSEVTRTIPRRSRVQKRVERSGQGQRTSRSRRLRTVAERTTKCLIPDDGLPPLCVQQTDSSGYTLQPNPNASNFMADVKDEAKSPVIFAVNHNLYVSVNIVTLDCCVNHTVWCFTTRGMTTVGQEEIVIVLETLPDETGPPRDVFVHLNNVFEDASKGNTITELGHSIISQSFLGSRDHGGFLYIRASFQCVQKLNLPRPPFLFGILLQKWETPWAKVFPLRLLLRLGAEYRYYPCPLIGVRNRKPVFYEIGHTIMNLLADFRNYQYMLPSIRGVAIHMQDKVTKINFPRNRYADLMKVVNNSNEHVMAIAASFSAEADSHLVCIQNDDGNYQTQAINIQSKPRKVTGASFVVFNGALKTSSGLSAKSSIVEDGLMVQITPDSMLALKQAIRDMHDYPINCGVMGALKPDETVVVQWVQDDKNVNIGVKSPIDGMSMDGIESLYIHNATDYVGEKFSLRWTEIFFIQNEERGSPKGDPADLSRIGETVATAGSIALTQHLDKLKDAEIERIGLRVTLGADNVGYEAGAKGEKLPDVYMNDLDNELIPVIHGASQPDISIVLELIFQVLE